MAHLAKVRKRKEEICPLSSVILPDLSALGNQDPTEHVRHRWDEVYARRTKEATGCSSCCLVLDIEPFTGQLQDL